MKRPPLRERQAMPIAIVEVRRQSLMCRFKVLKCHSDLPEMGDALVTPARLAGRHDRRNQNRDEQRRDGNDNQHFQHRHAGAAVTLWR